MPREVLEVSPLEGWLKLHRQITSSSKFADPDILRLWIMCLAKATHKETVVVIEKREIKLGPGQFVTGRFSLCDDYNASLAPRKKVKDTTLWSWLKRLEQWGDLDINTTNKYSVITVTKWSEYQGSLTTESQQNDNKLTAEPQQIDTNKNVKNEKNVEKEKKKDIEDIPYTQIVNYLNLKAKTRYKPDIDKTRDLIKARWNQGYRLEEFRRVIDVKVDEWFGTKDQKFLRPETLFGNKFEGYVNQPDLLLPNIPESRNLIPLKGGLPSGRNETGNPGNAVPAQPGSLTARFAQGVGG